MKKPYTNETQNTIYPGGVCIPPGQTRDVDEQFHPDYAAPEPEEDAPADPVAQILGHGVKAIVEMFPALSDEELEAVGAAEQLKGDDARKTLLAAIAEETLTRAEKGAA